MKSSNGVKGWKAISLAVLVAGVALLAYMIPVEGEPGALPLAMVLGGGIGFVVAAVRSRG